jgi:signal transduction histidine kinase
MRNIFETKSAAEASQPQAGKWEKIWDELPVGLFRISNQGKLEYANRYFSDWLDKTDRSVPAGEASVNLQISQLVDDCIKSGEPVWSEVNTKENRDTIIRIFPLALGAGKCEGVVGMVEELPSSASYQASLKKKINELSILCELSKVWGSTLNLEEILNIILTGVTAGQGLGFNRAFLLLMNPAGTILEGKIAIGPSNPEEAQRIWNSLSEKDQTLEEVLKSYQNALKEKDVLINQMVKKLKIPLTDRNHPLIKSMLDEKARHISRGEEGGDEALFDLLQTDQLAVAPLISKDKKLGVIVADNLINRKPIEDEAVKLLSICAHNASAVIETSQLYQQLAEKVDKLAEARKKIAENTRRLLKVERLSVLGQITSQVAHELRNPLTVIGGFAHSILKKMDGRNSDYEYLKIIVKETERMENTLNNVLNFSKPERFNLEMVDLNELVDQTVEMIESEIDSAKISIVKAPSTDLPLIKANPDLIHQALLNIFRNAVWAMPQGGILSVSTKPVGKMVRLEVKDTGCGIPSQYQNNVFDAFFTTKPDACGLGLTVSAEIIKNHGGKISVISLAGKGSTFNIELPSAREDKGEDSSRMGTTDKKGNR